MGQIFQYNKRKILIIIFLFIFSSCSVVRYIGGDKRWIKHDLGLSNTADSLMIPQNESYYNERIFKNKTGVYYCFNNDSISTNYIVWENGWHTIVLFDPNEKQKIYYSYDKKNRLRMLDRFSEHCNCYVTKIEFNKKGEIIYLRNKGVSF
jgi:hypothetical protein